jgi:hypothetical protein
MLMTIGTMEISGIWKIEDVGNMHWIFKINKGSN